MVACDRRERQMNTCTALLAWAWALAFTIILAMFVVRGLGL